MISNLQELVDERQAIPLAWVATTRASPWPNLGDALSAVMVAAIADLPIERRGFDDQRERLAAVGTIGHAQKGGVVHFWGTGIDPMRNAFDASLGRFAVPPGTELIPHAMRGRMSAQRLREEGVATPFVHGDPVWFLPKLVSTPVVEQTHELGIVLHITELESPTPESLVKEAYRRYRIPPSLQRTIRIINTYTENSLDSIFAKIDEMRSCRRIASTSFHGLVIAESFGIPNVWFSPYPAGGMVLDVEDQGAQLDHRARDFYSSTGKLLLPVYGTQRHLETDWEALIRWIDQSWTPLEDDFSGLFEAFPIRRAVSLDDAHWPLSETVRAGLPL